MYILIIIEAILSFEINRRLKFISPSFVIILYCMLSQIVYINADYLQYDYASDVVGVYSVVDAPIRGVATYFFISVMAWVGSININKSIINNKIIINKNFGAMPLRKLNLVSNIFIFLVIFHLLAINKKFLLLNNEYLLLSSRSVGVEFVPEQIFGLIQALLPLVSAASAALFFYALDLYGARNALLFFIVFLYGYVIQIAGASRLSCLILLCGLAARISSQNISIRKKILESSILIVLTYISYLSALSGRAQGIFGIFALPDIIASSFVDMRYATLFMITNFFQGIFIVADAVAVNFNFDYTYKILSFSIFPSAIDGFDLIRVDSEFRLHDYVPMPAIAEIWMFGGIWVVVGVLLFIMFVWYFNKMAAIDISVIRFMLCAVTIFILLQSAAYPIRNVFRQCFFLWIGLLFLNRYMSRPRLLEGNFNAEN